MEKLFQILYGKILNLAGEYPHPTSIRQLMLKLQYTALKNEVRYNY